MLITTEDGERINRMDAVTQKTQLGSKLSSLSIASAVSLPVEIIADATAGQLVTIPFAMRVTGYSAESHAASVGGTVTLRKSTAAIGDAVIMAVDNAVTASATIDRTVATLDPGDVVDVITANAGDLGLVLIEGYRL